MTLRLPRMVSVVIVLCTILGSGIMIGILLERSVLSSQEGQRRPSMSPPNEAHLLQILVARLELSGEQIEQIRPVLREMVEEGHRTFQKLQPVLKAQITSGRLRVRAFLNPQQASRFDELNKESDNRRLPFPPPGPPPSGGLFPPPGRPPGGLMPPPHF